MPAAVTVLVADDQARYREAISRLLTSEGYRVLEAADGLQALATCRHERPDVAVVDLVMPHLDGLGFCRALRTDTTSAYIPILFYSSRNSTADRVAALRAGGDDFVGKETDDVELVARLEALVRIRKMLVARRRATDRAQDDRAPVLPSAEATRDRLRSMFARAKRTGEPLSLLLVELEGAGELRDDHVTRVLCRTSRGDDVVGIREPAGWTMLLPSTHFGGAMATAERLWRMLPPRPGFAGLAVGVACYPNPTIDSAESLLENATAALQRARAEGPAYICLVHHQAYLFRPD